MKARGRWQGMITIARFNWPFYAGVAALLVGCVPVFAKMRNTRIRQLFVLGFGGAAYFFLASLGVSHWIYDRSDLYRWRWLSRALRGSRREQMIFCHSGFDEASAALREKLRSTDWLVLDHYDVARMSEPSIRRARRLFPPLPSTVTAPSDRWPAAADSADVVFGLLAIHELRSETERVAWFSEAKRCLRPGGRVILAEHTRDLANFLAFGPGALHFHSPASWRRCWECAGLRAADEFRVTPWVRIFVLAAE